MKTVASFLKEVGLWDNRCIFRGHADASWKLQSSIGREYCGDWNQVLKKERDALESFQLRAIPYCRSRPENDLEWLALMQHYGCPTRLLDFTTNVLIALFFASDPSVNKDGEVIVAAVPQKKAKEIPDVFRCQKDFAYFPSHISERIIGQSGCFVCCSYPNEEMRCRKLRRIIIDRRKKSDFRQELAALGVSNSTLFPGLEGICNDLKTALVADLDYENTRYLLGEMP